MLQAGGIAGTTVDISLYPVDTLKTRLQSAQGFAAAGGFRGVYAGIGSAALGSAPGAALFFVTYEWSKKQLVAFRTRDGMSIAREGPIDHMLAASLGEVAACAVRVPTEVIKQRAQATPGSSSLSLLKDILSQRAAHGVPGVLRELYRGWTATILREVPFTVIQFPLWEALKQSRLSGDKIQNSASESALFGCISGAVAAAATTPLDVIKTRMMLAKDKQGIITLARSILEKSGPSAFFAGIGPRICWISAGGAIFLGSYQWASNAMQGRI